MVPTTSKLVKKNLGTPDAVKEMPKTRIEWLDLEDMSLATLTLEPGWKWSEDIRPLANTESCQSTHVQYVISGCLRVVMDDGATLDIGPGDFVTIPAGHDASVIGNEPFCAIDLTGLPGMRKPGTISAADAHELLKSDPAAVLVCAYEKEADFLRNDLEGAISLDEFRKRKDSFPTDENVIFYCACPHDETATKQAREYYKQGFVNARILEGGVDAWRLAGYALLTAIA
jgi:rhodanese-related sulfurtransferase/mannose-6-phosphate isomerase-like protein (cupin superfamily)